MTPIRKRRRDCSGTNCRRSKRPIKIDALPAAAKCDAWAEAGRIALADMYIPAEFKETKDDDYDKMKRDYEEMKRDYQEALNILEEATESKGNLKYLAETLVLDVNCEYDRAVELENELVGMRMKTCVNCQFASSILSNYPNKVLCQKFRVHKFLNWGCADFHCAENS